MKRSFSSSDAKVAYNGREIQGFKKISYSYKENVAINKTGNNKSTSWSMGDEEITASVELYMDEIVLLEREAKAKSGSSRLSGLGEIIFAINYVNPDNEEVTDLLGFVINGNGREVGGSADGLAYALEITPTTLTMGV